MKDYVIEWEWEDHVQAGKITVKWIMKLAMWSVIIAYLPNIIWYFRRLSCRRHPHAVHCDGRRLPAVVFSE